MVIGRTRRTLQRQQAQQMGIEWLNSADKKKKSIAVEPGMRAGFILADGTEVAFGPWGGPYGHGGGMEDYLGA